MVLNMPADYIVCQRAGSLLKVAYETSVKLDSEGVKTWYSGMRQMLQKSTVNSLDNVLNMNNNNITEMCKMMYVNSWYDSISKERSKLQWYSKLLLKIIFIWKIILMT